ncbi:MAG: sulfatase [Treponema sp.]|nr:sulfatase [Treponema sp.]
MPENNNDLSFGTQARANVIWILTDQLRGQAFGYRGDPNVRTPNIDNLAREGMCFNSAVAGAPWCCPFRGSLLTGLYPHQNGVTKTPSPLDPTIPIITGPFKAAGYHTSWIGKWHLDGSNNREHYVPSERRGNFDYWMGYENNNNQNEVYIYGTDGEKPQRLLGYETDSLTDLFLEQIRKHIKTTASKDGYQPFFSVLSVQPPHSPYVPPTTPGFDYYHNPEKMQLRPNVPPVDWVKHEALLDYAGYYGMIENIDYNVGRIRMALKELDIDRDTYIIFFSDHGDCLGSHAQWEKSSPWEEAIKIPFIISMVGGPYNIKTGESTAVLNHVDIAPTTLGLCGIETPQGMVGHDYSNLCILPKRQEYKEHSKNSEPDSAYLQQIPRKFHRHSVNRPWRGVLMRDGWKYVCMPGNDWLLFDTFSDPYELANLCFDNVFNKKREECHARLSKWITDTGDEFAMPQL